MLRITKLLPLLICLTLASCLEFDAQHVTMRYDAENDRIDFLVVYEGLFYETGSDGGDVKKALEEYDEVMARGQCYFWSNWPLKVDVVKPPKQTAALAKHVSVENGKLFTDPTGQLNGYQFVRINDATEFVAKLNTMLELLIQGAMLTGYDGHKFDRDTKELVREFLRDKQKMVRLEAGRIELHLPLSKRDFKMALREFGKYFANNAAGEMARRVAVETRRAKNEGIASDTSASDVLVADHQLKDAMLGSPTFRFFWDNEIEIRRSEELQMIAVGAEGNRDLTVERASNGFYCDNFKKALEERGDKIEQSVPMQEIERRFEDFCKREPVLPIELAKIRKPEEAGADK
ncbi:MAG: hypothetical protein NXI31_21955 [bacterium]|nr:hypothetical protein [bacterium]